MGGVKVSTDQAQQKVGWPTCGAPTEQGSGGRVWRNARLGRYPNADMTTQTSAMGKLRPAEKVSGHSSRLFKNNRLMKRKTHKPTGL